MWMEQVPVEYRRTKEDSNFLRGALERDTWVKKKPTDSLSFGERNLFKSSAKNSSRTKDCNKTCTVLCKGHWPWIFTFIYL